MTWLASIMDSPLGDVARRADARADEIEELSRLPVDLVEDLIATGVFRTWVPAALGGAEGHVADLLDAIELVSYHEGSTGWCVMIGGTTALNAGFLPHAHAKAIYGDSRAVTGGFGMPAGSAAIVAGGGLIVDGHWPFGSGITHCTGIGGGVDIVDEGGHPAALPDGTRSCFAFFDRDDVELLIDSWQVMGLRGSGSVDYRVQGAHVPAGRWVSLDPRPTPVVEGPLYRFPLLGALALGVASVTIGLAARAVDELVALANKRPANSSRSLSERPALQAELAEAEAAARSARAWIREVVGECWDAAACGTLQDEHRRLIRLAANNAVERSAHAVDLCQRAAGGTAIHDGQPLQRVFRDMHVATQHGMVARRVLEPIGRMAFGLPTSTTQF